jgi:hypothetical protein
MQVVLSSVAKDMGLFILRESIVSARERERERNMEIHDFVVGDVFRKAKISA